MAQPTKKPTVKVYTTQTCPYCVMAKQFLHDNNIDFEEIDVSEHPDKGQEMVRKSGEMGVPQIEIGDTIIVGFDKAALKKILKI